MKKLIFFGLLSFLFSAVWLTPLAFITPYLGKIAPNIIMQNPQGTIWNGEVDQLSVKNNYLGKASWRVDPIKSLKSLSLKTNFTVKSEDIDIFGLAGLSINKDLIIDNTNFNIDAEYFNALQTKAKLSGSFNGFVNNAILKQNKVPLIDGIVNWQNGSLDAPIKLAKGDYRAELKPEDKDLDIKLSSKEAPIELNGDIKLQNDWTFNTNITTKSANPGLRAIMKFSGKPQSDGTILIKQTGDLKPFIGLN